MKKQVMFMHGLSQRRTLNGRILNAEMSYSQMKDLLGDKPSNDWRKIFHDPRYQHIFVCVYEDKGGKPRRVIGGATIKLETEDQIKEAATQMAARLHITLDRTLSVVEGDA